MEGSKKNFVGGNWKCNGSVDKNRELINDVINKLEFDPSKVGKEIESFASIYIIKGSRFVGYLDMSEFSCQIFLDIYVSICTYLISHV